MMTVDPLVKSSDMKKSVSYSLFSEIQNYSADEPGQEHEPEEEEYIHRASEFHRSEGSIYSYYENDQEFEMLVKTYMRDMKYTSLNQAALNIFYAMINAGLVALPFVAQESGIPLFILGMVVIAILSGYTSIMVISMASEQRVRTLEDLAECAYGKKGFYIVSILQIIFSFSMMCISINCWADIMADVFDETTFGTDVYMLSTHTGQVMIGGVLILPLCLWKRNMAKLSWTSYITVLSVIAAIFAIIATYLTDEEVSNNIFKHDNFREVTRIRNQWWALIFIGIYGYSYNQKVLTIYSSLRRRTASRWKVAVQKSTVGITLLYLLFGILGFVSKQRKGIKLDTFNFFLDNSDENQIVFDPARAMIAFSLLMTIPVDCLIAVTSWRRMFAKYRKRSVSNILPTLYSPEECGDQISIQQQPAITTAITAKAADGTIHIVSSSSSSSNGSDEASFQHEQQLSKTSDAIHSSGTRSTNLLGVEDDDISAKLAAITAYSTTPNDSSMDEKQIKDSSATYFHSTSQNSSSFGSGQSSSERFRINSGNDHLGAEATGSVSISRANAPSASTSPIPASQRKHMHRYSNQSPTYLAAAAALTQGSSTKSNNTLHVNLLSSLQYSNSPYTHSNPRSHSTNQTKSDMLSTPSNKENNKTISSSSSSTCSTSSGSAQEGVVTSNYTSAESLVDDIDGGGLADDETDALLRKNGEKASPTSSSSSITIQKQQINSMSTNNSSNTDSNGLESVNTDGDPVRSSRRFNTVLHSCEDNIRTTLVEKLFGQEEEYEFDDSQYNQTRYVPYDNDEQDDLGEKKKSSCEKMSSCCARSLCCGVACQLGELLPTILLWFLVVIISTIIDHWLYWAGSLCTWSNAGLMFLGPAILYFKLGLASDFRVVPWRCFSVSMLPNRVFMSTIKCLGYVILVFNIALIICIVWNKQFDVINGT